MNWGRIIGTIALAATIHILTINSMIPLALSILAVVTILVSIKLIITNQSSKVAFVWCMLGALFSIAAYLSFQENNAWTKAIVVLPILINVSLGCLFGTSLVGSNIAIITRIRLLEGTNSRDEIITYTRRLTAAWTTLFFISSLVLIFGALALNLQTWSWLANVAIPAVSIFFFVAEHIYRACNKEYFGPTSPQRTIQLMLKSSVWKKR